MFQKTAKHVQHGRKDRLTLLLLISLPNFLDGVLIHNESVRGRLRELSAYGNVKYRVCIGVETGFNEGGHK